MNSPTDTRRRMKIAAALRRARQLDSEGALPPAIRDILLLEEEWAVEGASTQDDAPVLDELITAMRQAETRFPWVALGYLRDALLRRGDTSERLALINEAVETGILLVEKIPNPRNPAFPTSAARLNRGHPRVVPHLTPSRPRAPRFDPMAIRGRPLSSTVLEDRR